MEAARVAAQRATGAPLPARMVAPLAPAAVLRVPAAGPWALGVAPRVPLEARAPEAVPAGTRAAEAGARPEQVATAAVGPGPVGEPAVMLEIPVEAAQAAWAADPRARAASAAPEVSAAAILQLSTPTPCRQPSAARSTPVHSVNSWSAPRFLPVSSVA